MKGDDDCIFNFHGSSQASARIGLRAAQCLFPRHVELFAVDKQVCGVYFLQTTWSHLSYALEEGSLLVLFLTLKLLNI